MRAKRPQPSLAVPTARAASLLQAVLAAGLRTYRVCISPLLGRHCRFYPTCSRYALTAVQRHGPWRGGLLALRRLSRCHPLHPGGVDFVPEVASPRRSPLDEEA